MAAAKATEKKTAAAAKPAAAAEPKTVEVAPGQTMTVMSPAPAAAYDGDCVVTDGTRHNGLAVNGGKVCSAHENRYYPDGKKRGE